MCLMYRVYYLRGKLLGTICSLCAFPTTKVFRVSDKAVVRTRTNLSHDWKFGYHGSFADFRLVGRWPYLWSNGCIITNLIFLTTNTNVDTNVMSHQPVNMIWLDFKENNTWQRTVHVEFCLYNEEEEENTRKVSHIMALCGPIIGVYYRHFVTKKFANNTMQQLYSSAAISRKHCLTFNDGRWSSICWWICQLCD